MPIEILASNRHQKIAGLNWSMWLQPLQFNNLLFPNRNTYIQKQLENPADIRLELLKKTKQYDKTERQHKHGQYNSRISKCW